MGENTAIEWTDATWNPTLGCSLVSPGCTNCYAMKLAARLHAMGNDNYRGLTAASKAGPVWSGIVQTLTGKTLLLPLHWHRPRRIFVNSMSDLFHESLSDEAIDRVFAVMALARQHTFQVLTKRPARMRAHLTAPGLADRIERAMDDLAPAHWHDRELEEDLPLPNVWLGTSVEDQARADERIGPLLETPAVKHFISAEPLLGPINLLEIAPCRDASGEVTSLTMAITPRSHIRTADDERWFKAKTHLDWVIAGGESGPGARPMHPAWARSLRDQCASAEVPFFFKQWGEWSPDVDRAKSSSAVICRFRSHPHGEIGEMWRVGKGHAGRHLDGVDHSEFPA